MQIELTKFLSSLSFALDYVEHEMLGSTPFHARRVAILSVHMAEHMHAENLYELLYAALLHDCALKEYLDDEHPDRKYAPENLDMSAHCTAGEAIAEKLPFYDRVRGAVLYHHEKADGTGTFGKKPEETPLAAQLIHIADDLDIRFDLSVMDAEKYDRVVRYAETRRGRDFSDACVDAFVQSADYGFLSSVAGQQPEKLLAQLQPERKEELSVKALRQLASIFADITDYKSHFTWRHSQGIAEKAEIMGGYYGYPEEECDCLYIAGALHDIGKLFIDSGILEKPGKLTESEYKQIQNHALGTHQLLDGIGGLEQIAAWAGNHHEKLDGTGYPFGKKADELSHHDRLMACLDIYQALREERPYKAGLSHTEAMKILNKMGAAGQLDTDILRDIDRCFVSGEAASSGKAVCEEKRTYSGETWRCPVCGYIYEGPLPDGFICPQCEQPGSIFERIH